MSKRLFAIACAIGLASVAWVGLGFAGSNWIAFAMTVVIGGVFLLGAVELAQFRRATAGLADAVANVPEPLPALGPWLDTVPAPLRNPVRLRIEGGHGALPGPALTPYLVGLLVMLGMLGTFLGMVVTFKGAVFALERSSDLQAMRSALADPIKGLGLSFGTSVAGVAASAMLGLMSALARRERLEVARELDARIATTLQPFSLVHQRQESFRAIQAQARTLPQLVERLETMMERIEQRSAQLDRQLLERQAQFHGDVSVAYRELAGSVGGALERSLAAGARAAGETIRPVVASAMVQVAQESQRLQARIAEVAERQVDALSEQFGTTARGVADGWTAALQQHARAGDAQAQALQSALAAFTDTFAERGAALVREVEEQVRSRAETEAHWVAEHGARMDRLAGVWRDELAALRDAESARGEAAVARLGALEAAVAGHLATLGAALEAPITRLLQTASEVPQAAAGVITELRAEMSRVAERDNLALQERTTLLERLGALLQDVQQASGEQRAAIEAMVRSASALLGQASGQFTQALAAQAGQAAELGAQFTKSLDAQAAQAAELAANFTQALDTQGAQASGLAAQIGASAVEMGALAEGFGQSVQLFQASNDKLTETLQRIEASLNRSTTRSDEQLAYYVAQAREVIDLSIASQQGLVEHLRQLQAKPPRAVALADGDAA